MLDKLWQLLCEAFSLPESGNHVLPLPSSKAELQRVEILKLWQQTTDSGALTLWAEVRNSGPKDLTFSDFTFFLAYTVHPGGGLMRGGNGIMGLNISLPQSQNLAIPADQTTTFRFYEAGDVVEIAPPKNRLDVQLETVLKRDHLRFQAAMAAEGDLMGALSVDPQATWIELRTPVRGSQDPNAGRILRHDSYEAPNVR